MRPYSTSTVIMMIKSSSRRRRRSSSSSSNNNDTNNLQGCVCVFLIRCEIFPERFQQQAGLEETCSRFWISLGSVSKLLGGPGDLVEL